MPYKFSVFDKFGQQLYLFNVVHFMRVPGTKPIMAHA